MSKDRKHLFEGIVGAVLAALIIATATIWVSGRRDDKGDGISPTPTSTSALIPLVTATPNPPTALVQLLPTATALSSSVPTQSALTEQTVLELLIPDPVERTLAIAKPIGNIGWVVETKTKTGSKDRNGVPCCGQEITFRYPGYGGFDFWGGLNWVKGAQPCEPTKLPDNNWHFECPSPMNMPIKMDGVSWYP